MPGALLPDDPARRHRDWYSPDELAVLPLSSKSHWDVPVRIGSTTLHLLASHPTPPAFDGPEDRNGRRNHDEIRFWSDYLRREAPLHPRRRGHARRLRAARRSSSWATRTPIPVDGASLHRRHRRAARASARRRAVRAAERRRRRGQRRAGRRERRAARRSALRHRRLQRPRAPATCASTIYCRRRASRCAAAACSGRRRPTRPRRWSGATARRRARITGWCGSTSA